MGAIINADGKKVASRNYQDNVIAPVDRRFDDEAAQHVDQEKEDENGTTARPDGVLSVISKVISSFFSLSWSSEV